MYRIVAGNKTVNFSTKFWKIVLTGVISRAIISIVESLSDSAVRGSVGIGRRARLRILWPLGRVGSSPIFRIQRVWALLKKFIRFAEVSELADEQDSGSCERYAREGSSPFFRIADSRKYGFRVFLFRVEMYSVIWTCYGSVVRLAGLFFVYRISAVWKASIRGQYRGA